MSDKPTDDKCADSSAASSAEESKLAADRESILIALDQLRQTMEVMGKVVDRLHRSVDQVHSLEEQRQRRARRKQSDEEAKPTQETPIILH